VRFSPFNFIDVDRDGQPTDGDEIVFHDKLLTRGDQVGDELGSCVIVDEGVGLANCTMVIRLARGQITAAFANSPPPRKTLAITGGTGSYRTVHGEGTLVEAGDGTGTLTLRIVR
jgi:Allene oxide cyclase barrel like domain